MGATVTDLIEFEWIVPESQNLKQVNAIEAGGGTVVESGNTYQPTGEEAGDYSAAGFEPLTVIVGAASAVYIAQAVTKMWRDRGVKGGVIVDTRSKKLRVRPVPSLPTGRLVLVDDTDTRVLDKEDENSGQSVLLDVLAKFGGKLG